MEIKNLLNNRELLEIGLKAVEDVLIELRDSRISILNRGNGLVIREYDGKESSVIRLGTEDALRIALKAIADFQSKEDEEAALLREEGVMSHLEDED